MDQAIKMETMDSMDYEIFSTGGVQQFDGSSYVKREVLLAASLENAMEELRMHERTIGVNYAVTTARRRDFGKADLTKKGKNYKVMWLDTLPFIVVNEIIYGCKFGPDKHQRTKERYRTKVQQGKLPHIKHRKPRDSIKLGCLATVRIREVFVFPDYAVPNVTKYKLSASSKRLRTDISNIQGHAMNAVKKFLLLLPTNEEHSLHPIGDDATEVCMSVDLRIWKKVEELVASSITNPVEIKQQLKRYVAHELFPNSPDYPVKTCKRFYPLLKDIGRMVSEILQKVSFSNGEQEKVQLYVSEYLTENPGDFFYFQPSQEFPKEHFLIIYQSLRQKHLLQRYGNDLCILEPAYRAIKYPFPIYFICVRTNVDYQIAAMFITKDDKTNFIVAALKKLKRKNKSWTPSYFVTEFCDKEIEAIEEVFPETCVLLCNKNREEIWDKWIKWINHVHKDYRDELLLKLKDIAEAPTFSAFKRAVGSLSASELWKSNEKLQNWFGNKWLPNHRRWVWFFRKDVLQLTLPHHEKDTTHPNYECLLNKTQMSLSAMTHILISQFLPESFNLYENTNVQCSTISLDPTQIPDYLMNRPGPFVIHCIERIAAACGYDPLEVSLVPKSKTCFSVHSHSVDDLFYKVDLGSEDVMPSCECSMWSSTKWPCKHFFAVFNLTNVSWENLSRKYRENPYLLLDTSAVSSIYETIHEEDDDCSSFGDITDRVDVIFESDSNLVGGSEEITEIFGMEPEPSSTDLNSTVITTSVPMSSTRVLDPIVGTQFALAAKCRDHLAEIRSKTFDLSEPILQNLQMQLQQTVEWLSVMSNTSEKRPAISKSKAKKRKIVSAENVVDTTSVDRVEPPCKTEDNTVVQVPIEIGDMNIVLEGPYQDMQYFILIED